MIIHFWYSLKYDLAIRHTDEKTSKVSWFDPKEKTEKICEQDYFL